MWEDKIVFEPYRDKYILLEDYQDETITVPRGFVFNGCSIPSLFYMLIGTPFDPRFIRGALVHDWLYTIHCYDKEKADNIFYINLRSSKVARWKAKLMKNAVAMFGGISWKNNKDDLKELAKLKDELIKSGEKDLEKYGWENELL
jgi:hypothetical protein